MIIISNEGYEYQELILNLLTGPQRRELERKVPRKLHINRAVELLEKVPEAVPRVVYWSKELRESEFLSEYGNSLNEIESRLACGESIRPYLSKSVNRVSAVDYCLVNRGFYHLHLGEDVDPRDPSFKSRTSAILFARFTQDSVYLVDILPHDQENQYPEFWDDHLVEVVGRNWPDLLMVLNGIMPGNSLSPQERRSLEKKGATAPSNFEGQVVLAGFGQTLAKTSIRSTIGISQDLELLNQHVKAIKNHLHEVLFPLCIGFLRIKYMGLDSYYYYQASTIEGNVLFVARFNHSGSDCGARRSQYLMQLLLAERPCSFSVANGGGMYG